MKVTIVRVSILPEITRIEKLYLQVNNNQLCAFYIISIWEVNARALCCELRIKKPFSNFPSQVTAS